MCCVDAGQATRLQSRVCALLESFLQQCSLQALLALHSPGHLLVLKLTKPLPTMCMQAGSRS